MFNCYIIKRHNRQFAIVKMEAEAHYLVSVYCYASTAAAPSDFTVHGAYIENVGF